MCNMSEKYEQLFTDEEMCRSLMEELENLTDEEWAMLDEMNQH